MDLHCPILAGIHLNVDVATTWARMVAMEAERTDMDGEAMAWVGVRFPSLAAVDTFLASNRDREQGRRLFAEAQETIPGIEVSYCPLGAQADVVDLGLMPTTAARLYLGSRWLASIGSLDRV
jgi:hypothetical protein